jgi:uncharacterized protein
MGGGGFGLGKGMGLGGMVLLLVLSLVTGRNFIGGAAEGPSATQTQSGGAVDESPEEAKRREFVTFVLNDVQETWAKLLPEKMNTPYREAKLVLFRDLVQSGCGTAQAATGPFYCPLDERAYIDLSFYDELQQKFGANGDFAQAYVLAHEIGHHVQTVLGTSQRVRELMERNPNAANQLSVRQELQADCYAGVWGATTNNRGILEKGDIEEGLNAAAAIGDDRISEMSGRGISPESFTHGTSAQRVQWFRRGLESGDPRSCDTFAGAF